MRPADWKMVSNIGLILGIIFLIGGAWIWLNVEGYLGLSGELEYWKYRGYSIPLLIAGVSLFVIGYACKLREEERIPPKPPD